jgi:hypothetical protein
MPEDSQRERVCPYLRGRSDALPSLTPGDDNLCLLASSIHLPRPQQARFCLGGRFEQCPRYQRQKDHPIPHFVRGARPADVRPSAPTIPLRTLPWRHPWALPALKWLIIILLAALFIFLWRWRMANTRPFVVEREIAPTPITAPVQEAAPQYLRPTGGPPEW